MNNKLRILRDEAKSAVDKLAYYLSHLDERNDDPSFVHAKMLFDEGWRLKSYKDRSGWCIWFETKEKMVTDSSVIFLGDKLKVLESLGLGSVECQPTGLEVENTIDFLIELTEETTGN